MIRALPDDVPPPPIPLVNYKFKLPFSFLPLSPFLPPSREREKKKGMLVTRRRYTFVKRGETEKYE